MLVIGLYVNDSVFGWLSNFRIANHDAHEDSLPDILCSQAISNASLAIFIFCFPVVAIFLRAVAGKTYVVVHSSSYLQKRRRYGTPLSVRPFISRLEMVGDGSVKPCNLHLKGSNEFLPRSQLSFVDTILQRIAPIFKRPIPPLPSSVIQNWVDNSQ